MLTPGNTSDEASGLLSSIGRGTTPGPLAGTEAAKAVDEVRGPAPIWHRRLLGPELPSSHPETASPMANDGHGRLPEKEESSWVLPRLWARARGRKHYAPVLVAAALVALSIVVPVVTLVVLRIGYAEVRGFPLVFCRPSSVVIAC